ncbi:hypothetical protein DRE_00160 [Drechslerella stenobrocha 248]|uniref:Uncharacterized protein n=1 Tax=Drechslerella stenobrocha 248 TaxID=1043628 RepID=W7IHU3_9PEZI|nr:hypothetical protein DRE_00160 [Drechslerella stenobrocha 248]
MSYTYEELLPTGSAKIDTPMSAVMWDLDTPSGSGLSFASPNKRARLYYLDPNNVLSEYAYDSTIWAPGSLASHNIQARGTDGISAVSFFRDNVENVRLYATTTAGQLQEWAWGAYGVLSWSQGSSFDTLQSGSPISFVNTHSWLNTSPYLVGFFGVNNQIGDISWNYTWSAVENATPLADTRGTSFGGYTFSAAAFKVDVGGNPGINLFWCGDGGTGGNLGTVYKAAFNRTTRVLASPAALSFQHDAHSYVLAVSATNGAVPFTNHLYMFAWGDTSGPSTFVHYNMYGDVVVLPL